MAAAVAGRPTVRVTAEQAQRLRNGQALEVIGNGEVAVVDEAGHLVAVGTVAGGWLRPEKVISGTA